MSVILITGANKGLGYETARKLTEQGHTAYIGARSVERGQAAAAELGAKFVQLDVTDEASVQTALNAIDSAERHLDVLVNNAGIWDGIIGAQGITGPSALSQFDTNVVRIVRVTQAALPLLRKSSRDSPRFWARLLCYQLSQCTRSSMGIRLPGLKSVPIVCATGMSATCVTRSKGMPSTSAASRSYSR
jgi:NAD(P)-dependent dehydrogenase (short-subunit alcohol dehydrogenase family)